MKPILDIRDPNYWRGVPQDAMWRQFRRAIDDRISTLNAPQRPRAVVMVRQVADDDGIGKAQGR